MLQDFANQVLEAAKSSKTGWFGDHKVFISHVHQQYSAKTWISREIFKRQLVAAMRAGFLTLSRADLVSAMSPHDVKASETDNLGAKFHFVRLMSSR